MKCLICGYKETLMTNGTKVIIKAIYSEVLLLYCVNCKTWQAVASDVIGVDEQEYIDMKERWDIDEIEYKNLFF